MTTPTGHQVDAHRITRPDGIRIIALTGTAAYDQRPGWTVQPVRGHHDPAGRGFIVTEEQPR